MTPTSNRSTIRSATRGFWRFEEQFGVICGENAGEENTNLLCASLRASLGAEYALRPWAAVATGVQNDFPAARVALAVRVAQGGVRAALRQPAGDGLQEERPVRDDGAPSELFGAN
jgi:hypothetical protein